MPETSEVQPTRSWKNNLGRSSPKRAILCALSMQVKMTQNHDSALQVACLFLHCSGWLCCLVRRLRRALPASHRMWTLSNASHHGLHANELEAAFIAAFLPRGPSLRT